jgi:hypothetical protein
MSSALTDSVSLHLSYVRQWYSLKPEITVMPESRMPDSVIFRDAIPILMHTKKAQMVRIPIGARALEQPVKALG